MASIDGQVLRTELTFSRSVYDIDAVKRAAYELMPKLRVAIDASDDLITCVIQPAKEDETLKSFENHVRDFEREVVDQDLRLTLEARTEPLRSTILGLAFSKTGLQDG